MIANATPNVAELDAILAHLRVLIADDSQNPPRAISADSPMFVHVRDVLPVGFDIETVDHGDGHVSLHARRGAPELLFNCHLDTVPVGEGWSVPPLALTVKDGRAWGRGSCDIKGAAAALLHVATTTDAPMALLLTTDEEGAGGCCVKNFLDGGGAAGYSTVVVCEPTGNRAVLSHRGYLSVKGRFRGTAGHSSEFRALDDSAVHAAGRWMAAALAHCRTEADAGRPTCFNIGTVDGGIKSNVIADRCDLHWSARLAPGGDNGALFAAVAGLAGADQRADWHVPFSGPPLPAAGRDPSGARAFANAHGLAITESVDFWTEAALFSDAGLDALVCGPGHIEQAHIVDEWVALDQLLAAYAQYRALVERGA
ncbi:acetylornithine deacetylase [Wenzhouxiangella sp. XN79A]|uniref:acetylornithine deacetylase n=1 Tax=Wenzhouxiangella sp. XN79A TaxID=2724193 RepID=UPI00144AB390|nr:acetylornithine deacetylase [Wenzhouxiangella sp. XN79A]